MLNNKVIRIRAARSILQDYASRPYNESTKVRIWFWEHLFTKRVEQARAEFLEYFEMSSGVSLKEKVITGLGYTWRVIWHVIKLLVVIYVFLRLENRFEIIVVSILGLMYVTINAMSGDLRWRLIRLAIENEKNFSRMRRLLGEDTKDHEGALRADEKEMLRQSAKPFIDLVFLFIISLVCLFHLLMEL